jgi:membrane protease YdiL (CAAX protease family)
MPARPALAPSPAGAFALVAAVWLGLFSIQSSWPGDTGVAVSFSAALLLIAGFDHLGRNGPDRRRRGRPRSLTRRPPPRSGRLAPARPIRRGARPRARPTTHRSLVAARRWIGWAGWCALGIAVQPWLAALAIRGFEHFSGEPVTLGARANPGACRAMSLWLLAPVFEEVLYRDRLFRALADTLRPCATVVTTATFFALPHAGGLGIVGVGLAGLLLGAVRAGTGRLGPCIALHVGFNLAASLRTPLALFGL